MQRLEKILAQKTAPKVPEWPSYGNLDNVTQNPHFLKKCKGVTKRKFFKNHQKVALAWKAQKHWRKLNYTLIKMHLKCKNCTRFRHKQWLQKCPNGQVMAIIARLPKTRIFWKRERGEKDKFFKNRLKTSPRFKGLTALWRRLHYTLISMQLKLKDWRKFWRKRRIQNCLNGQFMAHFARLPKTRIF